MTHQEQRYGGIRLLGDVYGPCNVGDLVGVPCATVNRACRFLRVESGAPESALVESEDDEAAVGPAPMNVFVARHVFYKAVDEDDDAARRTRRGLVSASVEGQRFGTGEPGFGEVGHRVVDDRGEGATNSCGLVTPKTP